MKKKLEPPNLDKYLKTKHKFVSYATGAKLYSLPYYTFVNLVKRAGANIKVRGLVVVDLAILEKYLDETRNMEED